MRGIRIAVLVICGEFDQVRQPTCEYYRSLIPGSRMAIIPDASQTSYLEQPNVFYWTRRSCYECCVQRKLCGGRKGARPSFFCAGAARLFFAYVQKRPPTVQKRLLRALYIFMRLC